MTWGITFDCLPLVESPHQDSWLCAQNGEVALALELAFLCILEMDMGDPHARASTVRETPVDLGVQRTQTASVFSTPSYKVWSIVKGGRGTWRSRLGLGSPWTDFWCFSLLPWIFCSPTELKKCVLYLWWKEKLVVCQVLNSSMHFPILGVIWSSWEAAEQCHRLYFRRVVLRCRERKRPTSCHVTSGVELRLGPKACDSVQSSLQPASWFYKMDSCTWIPHARMETHLVC